MLHIGWQPPGVEIRPFHMTSQSLVPDVSGPEDTKRIGSLRELHLVKKIPFLIILNFVNISHFQAPSFTSKN
jgi:hypothetical protein